MKQREASSVPQKDAICEFHLISSTEKQVLCPIKAIILTFGFIPKLNFPFYFREIHPYSDCLVSRACNPRNEDRDVTER